MAKEPAKKTVKTAAAAPAAASVAPVTASATETTEATQDAQSQEAKDDAKPQADAQVVFVDIGKDEHANADALQELLSDDPEYPLNLIVRNTVAMPFVLPLVPGFKLGHVAGDPAKAQRVVRIRSRDELQQVCLDIQEILTLNGLPGCIQMARTDAAADE